MKLSVVIPCYCSENTVADVIDRTIHTIEADGRYGYEFICVNDCSRDGTLAVLKELSKANPLIKVISFTKNFGQHSALMAGFANVSGDIVVSMDDDGQSRPEDLFKLVDKLEEGYDLVSAKFVSEHRSLFRRTGSKVSMAMSNSLVGMPDGIELNSYCVFRRFVADEIVKYTNAYPFVHGLMLRVTRNIANVDLERGDREDGVSGYTFKKLLSLWMNGFTAFSEKPLRVASAIGAILAIIGMIAGVFVIIRKIIDPSIAAGYSSLMAVMLFLAGIIMLFLGLLGEYIGRIYICINNAPQYVIRETINL